MHRPSESASQRCPAKTDRAPHRRTVEWTRFPTLEEVPRSVGGLPTKLDRPSPASHCLHHSTRFPTLGITISHLWDGQPRILGHRALRLAGSSWVSGPARCRSSRRRPSQARFVKPAHIAGYGVSSFAYELGVLCAAVFAAGRAICASLLPQHVDEPVVGGSSSCPPWASPSARAYPIAGGPPIRAQPALTEHTHRTSPS